MIDNNIPTAIITVQAIITEPRWSMILPYGGPTT